MGTRVQAQRMAALAAKARSIISDGSKRIFIQVDPAVTTRSSGTGMALARTASIVEQAAHLHASGREVTLMCSGAAAVGKQKFQSRSSSSPMPQELPIPSRPLAMVQPYPEVPANYEPSEEDFEALGNYTMMAAYDRMFKMHGISCGHLSHIPNSDTLARIQGVQKVRSLPVIGMSGSSAQDTIASGLAQSLECDLLILLSEAEHAYDTDPSNPVSVVNSSTTDVSIQDGLQTKLQAARQGMQGGVPTVIASGFKWRSILDVVEGKDCGTIFMDVE